jgi:hypothetical protein
MAMRSKRYNDYEFGTLEDFLAWVAALAVAVALWAGALWWFVESYVDYMPHGAPVREKTFDAPANRR